MTEWREVLHDDPSWSEADAEAHLDALVAEPRSLLDADPRELTFDGQLEMLGQIQQAQSRLAALEAEALVATAGSRCRQRNVRLVDEDSGRLVDLTLRDEVLEELAAELRLTPGQVYERVTLARMLEQALPATRRALAEAEISPQHARVIADQARRFDGALLALNQAPELDSPAEEARRAAFLGDCAELERRVLSTARRDTASRTRSAARRAVASIDAAGEERRRREARATSDVRLCPDEDGMALLEARLPAEQAVSIHAALDARARQLAENSDESIGALRVRALVEAVSGDRALAAVTTEVQVVIDLASLLGHDDQPATVHPVSGAPHIITAQAVRDLIADRGTPASLRRLVTDPLTGSAIDRGRRSYAVSHSLRAYLVARDATCRFPGCGRAARRCQVDHAVAWQSGGSTDRHNLGHLCTRHHLLKTHANWDIIESRPDGSCTWRSPRGRRYDVDPPPL